MTGVRRSFGFVLLAVRDKKTTSTELASVLGVSKQAMSKLLDAMEQAGFVKRATASRDARMRTVELAARGRRVRRVLLDAHGGTLPAVRAIGSGD